MSFLKDLFVQGAKTQYRCPLIFQHGSNGRTRLNDEKAARGKLEFYSLIKGIMPDSITLSETPL